MSTEERAAILSVSLAYGNGQTVFFREFTVTAGCNMEQAIFLSEIKLLHPEINSTDYAVGIFNEQVSLNTELKDGDRVEIYRPLLLSPMEARRKRADETSS